KKGNDIKVMEVTDLTSLADYFVICTGSSTTQINALCDCVEEKLEVEGGEKALRREGHRGGIWVLIDYGCVVVHVFNDEAREFYALERLWNDGKNVDLSEVLASQK
ncbi:MAG: ribosome silencing factor, partial [Oscillospiraceae bacterium]|nr:ribosome silencing factor [Oscillospiraceae bacterium]